MKKGVAIEGTNPSFVIWLFFLFVMVALIRILELFNHGYIPFSKSRLFCKKCKKTLTIIKWCRHGDLGARASLTVPVITIGTFMLLAFVIIPHQQAVRQQWEEKIDTMDCPELWEMRLDTTHIAQPYAQKIHLQKCTDGSWSPPPIDKKSYNYTVHVPLNQK